MSRCFVIMPFSKTTSRHTEGYWTRFFKDFITPAVEAEGYDCIRSTAEPRNIVSGILDELLNSDVVLAVLTDSNPNVWYELGIRHTSRHGTIMMIEKGQRIPFDVRHFGVLTYNDKNVKAFRAQLRRFFDKLPEPKSADSPVLDYLATARLNVVRSATSVIDSPCTFEKALIDAREQVLIVGQNLNSLVTDSHFKTELDSILRSKKIYVRLLVVDPKRPRVPLAYNDVLANSFSTDLTQAAKGFHAWNQYYARYRKRFLGTFEARGSARVGTFSLTFIDPERSWGKLLITPVSWMSESKARPCFWMNGIQHRTMLDMYYSKFETIFRAARRL